MRIASLREIAILAAAALAATGRGAAAMETERPRPRLAVELAAGPLIGLDAPLRGGSAALMIGMRWGAIEAGLRASAAIDRALDSTSMRLDLELGLGGGMRAIVGGLAPLSPPVLEPEGAALPLEATAWPCRFGLSAEIARLAEGPFGAAVEIEASMVYCAYRVAGGAQASAEAALSGASAFASCVEVSATIALAWGPARGVP